MKGLLVVVGEDDGGHCNVFVCFPLFFEALGLVRINDEM